MPKIIEAGKSEKKINKEIEEGFIKSDRSKSN